MSACTDWRDHYKDAQNSDDNDPFPKMLDGEDDSILGPYVATEIATVENVRAHQLGRFSPYSMPSSKHARRILEGRIDILTGASCLKESCSFQLRSPCCCRHWHLLE